MSFECFYYKQSIKNKSSKEIKEIIECKFNHLNESIEYYKNINKIEKLKWIKA